MNPIERLEAIHNEMVAVQFHAPDGWYKKRADIAAELRAIISELKQRDEEVRKVAEEMEFEPRGLMAQFAGDYKLRNYSARLRAALEGKP